MANKKFKTIAGYLRSAGDNHYYAQEKAKLAGVPALSDEEVQRRIINNLLPQIGIAGQIGPTEKPIDVVTRLRQAPENEKRAKELDTCLQWLGRRPGPRIRPIRSSAVATGVTITRDGEDFTWEEFHAIERLAVERAIDFNEAKAALRAERAGA
jgi:hypothetical protein